MEVRFITHSSPPAGGASPPGWGWALISCWAKTSPQGFWIHKKKGIIPNGWLWYCSNPRQNNTLICRKAVYHPFRSPGYIMPCGEQLNTLTQHQRTVAGNNTENFRRSSRSVDILLQVLRGPAWKCIFRMVFSIFESLKPRPTESWWIFTTVLLPGYVWHSVSMAVWILRLRLNNVRF